jgi:hypothetical protein
LQRHSRDVVRFAFFEHAEIDEILGPAPHFGCRSHANVEVFRGAQVPVNCEFARADDQKFNVSAVELCKQISVVAIHQCRQTPEQSA